MPTADQLIAKVNSFPWREWAKKLRGPYEEIYRDYVVSSAEAAAEEAGVAFEVDDPFTTTFMTEYVGERITQLEGTTKDDVIRTIRTALNDGEGLAPQALTTSILDAVRAKFEAYEAYRATRIARTETSITYNQGTALTAQQAGFDLDVTDGDEDEECAAANGDVWTAEEALADPISHPNCTRAFAPHIDESDVENFLYGPIYRLAGRADAAA